MILTEQEKTDYLHNVVVEQFKQLWLNKTISSTIFDTNGHVVIMSEQAKSEFGINSNADISKISFYNPTVEDIAKFVAISNPEYTESIMQISLKQAKLLQIVVSEKMPLNFISFVPRYNQFKARLINYLPIFHPSGEVVGIQSFASQFNLFGINEYLDVLQNKPSSQLEILSNESDLPLKLAKRQHEILFLLAIGLSQANAAQILNISRGALAAVVNNVLCPKFGINGSSTKILIDKAVAMNYNKYIPKSLCKPFIVILDINILEKYFMP